MFALVGCLEHRKHTAFYQIVAAASLLVRSVGRHSHQCQFSLIWPLACCVCVLAEGNQQHTCICLPSLPVLCANTCLLFYTVVFSLFSLFCCLFTCTTVCRQSTSGSNCCSRQQQTVYYTANNTVVCLPGLPNTRGREANNDRKGIMRAQSG